MKKITMQLLQLISIPAFLAFVLFWSVKAKASSDNVVDQTTGTGTISGRVTDSQNNPIEMIFVAAYQWIPTVNGGSWAFIADEVPTDSNGIYTLTNLPATQIRIRFSENFYRAPIRGYASEYYSDSPTIESATSITLAENEVITGINAQLEWRGRISGVLQDWNGNRLPNTLIYPVTYSDCCGWMIQSYSGIFSNNLGVFTWFSANSSTYGFYIVPTTEYPGQYYNRRFSIDTLTPITVIKGLTTPVTFTLVPYSSILGTVTSEKGTPISDIEVSIWRNNNTGGGIASPVYIGATQTDENGEYILGPLSGDSIYSIGATSTVLYVKFSDNRQPPQYASEYFDNAVNLENATPVTVTLETATIANEQLAFSPDFNQPPVARNDFISLTRGTTSNILSTASTSVLTNDQDAENAPLQATLVSDPLNGSLILNSNGTFTYTHNGSATTGDSFTYQASDGVNQSNVATVLITVTDAPPVNTSPIAQNDAIRLIRGASSNRLTDGASTLLANDVDAENAPLQAILVTNPVNGVLMLNANGTFTYTHNGSATTSDSFTYQASDGINLSNIATVTITITDVPPVNLPPIANPDALNVIRGGQSNILIGGVASVLANDQDAENGPLQATLVANAINGTLTLNANGTFTYTHDGSVTTSDSFTYQASDGVNRSNVSTVTITITAVSPVNTPPVANPDALTVDRGGQSSALTGGTLSLLANDQDAENSLLQARIVTNPINGALTLNANGTFTYTHNNSKTTSDLFTYRASDGVNQSNIATVTIIIKPLVSFEFSKTVSILGIEPACGAIGTMKVPVTTTINYCYSITNSGDVTLTTHSLIDDKLGTLLNNAAITLSPGATHRVQFSQTLTVNTTNIATWTATANVAGLTAAELDALDVAQAIKQATITISAPTDDQDGDTIPDNLESAGDADGDNLPNFLDTDANGNGIVDSKEIGANLLSPTDSNGNGIPDYLDLVKTTKTYLPLVSR